MSKVKVILVFFLSLAGFLFIGESHIFFLENFQDSYVQVGYFLETGDSEDEMKSEILEKSKEYDTEVFAIKKEDGGAFSRKITIYGNEKVGEILKEDWDIEEGIMSSFFSGKTEFEFQSFNDAREKELSNCWYIGKTTEELHTMLYPKMVRYSGSFRNDPMDGMSEQIVAGVWLLLIMAILLLSYYDIVYSKKEQMIRIVLGGDSKNMILHKFISDTVGYLIAVIAAILVLLPFTNPLFRWNISIIGFLALIISNDFLIIAGMRIRGNLRIKSVTSSKNVLYLSILFRGVIAILTIIVLSTTIYLSVEGMKLYRQKDYYSELENKVHVGIDYPYDYEKMEDSSGFYEDRKAPLNTWEQVDDNFLRYSYRELDFSLMTYQPEVFVAPKWGDKYVWANLKGLEPYGSMISDWDKLSEKEGSYILIPEGSNKSEILEEVMKDGGLHGLMDGNLLGVITYKKGLSLIAEGVLEEQMDYSFRVKNPIIFLDTFDYGALPVYPVSYSLKDNEQPDGMIAKRFAYLMQFTTLDKSEEKLYKFADEISGDAINPNLVEFTTISVGDWFEGLWSLQNRSLLIAIILTVLIIVLELQISSLTLRMTYESKAQELTIKKVMGYSIFERFKPFFLMLIILCGLSLIGAVLFSKIFKIGLLSYIILGSIIVFIMDISLLIYWIKKHDNMQIQKVLKGGI